MAKGQGKKRATAKKAIIKNEVVAPELVGQSFASAGWPIRTAPNYGNGFQAIWTRYPNLYAAGLPYQYGEGYSIVISDAVLLCQKAYYRIPTFKISIDTMSELCSNAEVYLDGGNTESKTFFEAWLNRINITKLKDQFFREFFRSGNIFFYRVDGNMTQDGAKKLKNLYAKAANVDIPLRYILLNPVSIAVYGSLNFDSPVYYRVLNKLEVDLLRNSDNPDDKEIYKNLPKAIKNYFDGGQTKPIPIDPKSLHTVFYKKQDYEPFAVPLGFAVLDSIELKLAMQRSDAVIARTVEYAILLITMGEKKSEGGTNPESLRLLKEVFKKEEIGRVLVSDYTTKADFVIPNLKDVLGPEKYRIVNEDIADGLSNIFFTDSGGTGRANTLPSKLKVFSEKLNNALVIFANEFLNPEIKRISKLMGFKSYPSATMGEIDLDDQSQMMRVYAQLMQLGILTPKDGLEAMERGEFPEYDELHDNQTSLKTDKDKGLFQPLVGGPYTQIQVAKLNQKGAMDLQQSNQDHQAEITKQTQQHDMKKTKMTLQHNAENPQPQPAQIHLGLPGTSIKTANPPNQPKPKQPTGRPPGATGNISMSKLMDNVRTHSKLIDEVTIEYKKRTGSKKLTNEDKENIATFVRGIVETENPDNWIAKAKDYVENPQKPSTERMLDIEDVAAKYGISSEAAAIVFHSETQE